VPIRARLAWSDLGAARVGVWGTGVEGRANVARLAAMGADIVIVDDAPAGDRYGRWPVVATSSGGLELLAGCDAVVKSPGISRNRPDAASLVAGGVALTGGLALWMAEAPLDRVVAVTGTKGKSTTTAILGHLLASLGHRCATGGNLGTPPWDPAGPRGVDLWVVEVSSYQAADLSVSPPVVAVTSLSPDHLDWHGTVDRYYADKLSACSREGAALTVASDTAELRGRRGMLGPEVAWVGDDPETDWAEGLGLLGSHNLRNAAVARRCLEALGVPAAADPARLASASRGFQGLASRLRPVLRVDGVDFIDDSLSTNVLPTVAAVEAVAGRRLALLVGGFDRGLSYGSLAGTLDARGRPTLLVTLPDNGPDIGRQLRAAGLGAGVEIRDAPGIEEATGWGFNWARPDGVVLLSPAAASFGRYRDYRDRAAAFLAAARTCGPIVPAAGAGTGIAEVRPVGPTDGA